MKKTASIFLLFTFYLEFGTWDLGLKFNYIDYLCNLTVE